MGRPSGVQVTGPLATYSDGFRLELTRQGFTANSACPQLQLMAHASRWLATQGLGVVDLTPSRVKDFLDARRAEGYTMWLSPKAMIPMLGYLRGIGVVATPVPAAPSTPAAELIETYRIYLVQEKGLAKGTVADYLHVARLFLATRPAEGDLGLERLSAAEVSDFVLAECTSRRVGSAKSIVCGLRSLMRYLYLSGRTEAQLAAAVPKVAGWRLAGLPKAVSPHDVARLLASCDLRSTFGRRDFAVLSIFARLGLRSGEVAALELADIDWRAGEIVVRGKGRRQERLPLPVDVGEAIAGWLHRGRPRCESTKVFTRVRAPHQGLSAGGVTAIVRSACGRAGLPAVHAHRLRHTAATEMLRAGASLAEVGQVLRHASVLTTAIYAKVDRSGLRALALPWPGSAS